MARIRGLGRTAGFQSLSGPLPVFLRERKRKPRIPGVLCCRWKADALLHNDATHPYGGQPLAVSAPSTHARYKNQGLPGLPSSQLLRHRQNVVKDKANGTTKH